MKKKMLGVVIDLIENQIYDHNEIAKGYLSRRYNVFFDDGSVLSLWEQGDTSPSGCEACTYGYWAWHESVGIKFNWQMQPIEVNIFEALREDKEAVKVILGNGDLIASADKYGVDEYYPEGFAQAGFEARKPKKLAWFIVDLETFQEQNKPVAQPGYYDLSLAGRLADDEEFIRTECQNTLADVQPAVIIGKEVDFKVAESSVDQDKHLIEVKCVNQTLDFN
jgi:hypothetical protein